MNRQNPRYSVLPGDTCQLPLDENGEYAGRPQLAADGSGADETPPALTKTYGKSVFDPRWGDGEPRANDEYDAHAQQEVRTRMKRRWGRMGGGARL